MLRYNFPAAGLTDDALRTLILLVLATGRRRAPTPLRPDGAQLRAAQSPQMPKISMVWLTSEKPCSRATSAAHVSTSAARDLDRGAARPAHQVMVVVRPSSAGTPIRRCRCAACRRGRRPPWLQGAVHGGQSDVLAAPAQFVVQFLRRAELVDVVEERGDRRALPGRANDRCRVTVFGSAVLGGVRDGVQHDVGQMVVDEAVEHLAAGCVRRDHARGLEDAQVLADQWLRHASASTSSCTQRGDSRSCSTIAMRTGAASARRMSPAVSRTSRGGRSGNGAPARGRADSTGLAVGTLPAKLETVFIMAPDTCTITHVNGSRDADARYRGDTPCCRSDARAPGIVVGCVPPTMCSTVASVIDTVVNLAKRRGLVYQSGEIYGGTKSAWDYGPLGVELKENIKRQWWRVGGHRPRRRRRPGQLDHPAARGVGGLRSRRGVQRPARRVPELPQASPPGPHAGGVRGEEGRCDDPDDRCR